MQSNAFYSGELRVNAIECRQMQSKAGECNRMQANSVKCWRMQSTVANAVQYGGCNRMRENSSRLKSSAVNCTRMQSIAFLHVHRIRLAVTPSVPPRQKPKCCQLLQRRRVFRNFRFQWSGEIPLSKCCYRYDVNMGFYF